MAIKRSEDKKNKKPKGAPKKPKSIEVKSSSETRYAPQPKRKKMYRVFTMNVAKMIKEKYEELGNLKMACDFLDVNYHSFLKWRKLNPEAIKLFEGVLEKRQISNSLINYERVLQDVAECAVSRTVEEVTSEYVTKTLGIDEHENIIPVLDENNKEVQILLKTTKKTKWIPADNNARNIYLRLVCSEEQYKRVFPCASSALFQNAQILITDKEEAKALAGLITMFPMLKDFVEEPISTDAEVVEEKSDESDTESSD